MSTAPPMAAGVFTNTSYHHHHHTSPTWHVFHSARVFLCLRPAFFCCWHRLLAYYVMNKQGWLVEVYTAREKLQFWVILDLLEEVESQSQSRFKQFEHWRVLPQYAQKCDKSVSGWEISQCNWVCMTMCSHAVQNERLVWIMQAKIGRTGSAVYQMSHVHTSQNLALNT